MPTTPSQRRSINDAPVLIVGFGYVGIPTAIALSPNRPVLAIDIDQEHVERVLSGNADLTESQLEALDKEIKSGRIHLVSDWDEVGDFSAAIICVPTPVDDEFYPHDEALAGACGDVVERAQAGQTIVLTSTSAVGSTRRYIIEPLAERGLIAGEDIHVAFAPERILPGVDEVVPRVVGGERECCTDAAIELLEDSAAGLHRLSSPEAAEMCKLYENSFRAINLALANELAGACSYFNIDPNEVIEGASTKPYGFLAHHPSAGVGGHCIPVDPYYLLRPLEEAGVEAPIFQAGMAAVRGRALDIAERAFSLTSGEARILVEGATYKPGLKDARHAPGDDIARELKGLGADVVLHDPLVYDLSFPVKGADFDLVVVAMLHPGLDYSWLDEAEVVLDCTYQIEGAERP